MVGWRRVYFIGFVAVALALLAACGPGRTELRTQAYPLKNQAFTGTSGTITFTKRPNGAIEARIELTGTVEGMMHPAHIHANDAATGGGILRTFTAVNGTTGASTTVFSALDDGSPISFDALLELDGYVNVHYSAADANIVIATGNIGANANKAVPDPESIAELAEGAGSFSILLSALAAAGLDATFADPNAGPFTVFAPTDDAFAALVAELGITLEALLARDDLADILRYHVLPQVVVASEARAAAEANASVPTLLEGASMSLSLDGEGNIVIDERAVVASANLAATNGVVHVIDAVLLPGAPISPDEFGEAFSNHMSVLMGLSEAAFNDLGMMALGDMPPFEGLNLFPLGLMAMPLSPGLAAQALELLLEADTELPRGIYEWNDEFFQWIPVGPSDDLVLRWTGFIYDWETETSTPYSAEVVIDWISTTTAKDHGGMTVEVPTAMALTLTVNDTEAAALTMDFSWYDAPACDGPILEPSSFAISGTIGVDATITLSEVSLTITDSTITTSGAVTVAHAGESVTLEWDLSVSGQIQRDDACYLEDMQITSGSIFIATSATIEGETGSFSLGFDFANVVVDEWGELVSLELSNGEITLNGQVAVSFFGTLDDLDSDCPGQNVTLVFADGSTMTLCEFVTSLEPPVPVPDPEPLLQRFMLR